MAATLASVAEEERRQWTRLTVDLLPTVDIKSTANCLGFDTALARLLNQRHSSAG